MPIPQKIIKFLEKNKVKYEEIKHRTVYTAYDKAQTLKIPEKIIGKTLVVKLERNFALVLVPANKNLNKRKLLKIANIRMGAFGYPSGAPQGGARLRYSHADFAKEGWMKKKLKGVKVGAIPPLGNLWGLLTLIDRSLMKERKIIINSGSYTDSLKISPAVLKKLAPDLLIGGFSQAKR